MRCAWIEWGDDDPIHFQVGKPALELGTCLAPGFSDAPNFTGDGELEGGPGPINGNGNGNGWSIHA